MRETPASNFLIHSEGIRSMFLKKKSDEFGVQCRDRILLLGQGKTVIAALPFGI